MSIIEQIMGIVAPHHCLVCGSEGSLLCTACGAALPPPLTWCIGCGAATPVLGICTTCQQGSPISAVIAATTYSGIAKELVHLLKFERAAAAAGVIGRTLALLVPAGAFDAITFVPTAPARVRTRGYDQAARIARALSRETGLPCHALLARTGNQRQVGQGRSGRRGQMQRAFYVRRSGLAHGQRLLLVDDVLTTGASCQAAARALRDAGAAAVTAAVFAATPPAAMQK